MTIKTLFDPSRDINREIEKVITYGADQDSRLKAEILEYQVTASIEEQFRKLLDRMQRAMDAGGEHEVGVWVSGFYGSGKSSFTKYLGFALDPSKQIDGVPFLKHLQDRLHNADTRALLGTVAQRYPAAVIMLDLASEQLAGATMKEVSTVLYFKVLQWAGFSRNLKVAALERRMQKEGRFDEFLEKVQAVLPGVAWADLQNDPLAVDALVAGIAHQMYPSFFPTETSFNTASSEVLQFENDRVKEMLDIVRDKSGKPYAIFVIDEVGQYLATRNDLILNLDGLAKNIKQIGDGKAWIISTAQQTLTEDDQRVALNSPQLFKLKDRFPIQIDLEASDIKEICYRRLLGKSPDGEATLGKMFEEYGQALRQNTKLQDAKFYEADFNRQGFVNFYPFLPAHFDILLHLLGALAKSTGGIGLRSAIKVIQDVLRGEGGSGGMANQSIGWLATTVTLYDELEKDIRVGFQQHHQVVTKIQQHFHGQPLYGEVAKTIAVLQILNNIPIIAQNIASLMHPGVTAASRADEIRDAIQVMLKDPQVPISERDGQIVFLSDRLREVEKERGETVLRSSETRRIFGEALRNVFDPLPRVSVQDLAVTAGLKSVSGGMTQSLAGDSHPIQLAIEVVESADFDTAQKAALEASRERTNAATFFLVAANDPAIEALVGEIYRSQRIVEVHRNTPEQEVRDYCNGQTEQAEKWKQELAAKIRQMLIQGAFVFRGQVTAASAHAQDILEAAKRELTNVAGQVFDRYAEAAAQVNTDVAERFLRASNPAQITSVIDPLGLVHVVNGQHRYRDDHKAMLSIADYVRRTGSVEGKRLLDHFAESPFGWRPDTTRYVLAGMFMAGEIRLRISGLEVTNVGQKSIEALKTNNSFKQVGVSLRDDRPSNEALGLSATRLEQITGEPVLPLEQEIAKAATKSFVGLQRTYGDLASKLSALGLPGVDRVTALSDDLEQVIKSDGSDAPARLGAEESELYNNLIWAQDVKRAFDQGLETTLGELVAHRDKINALPDSGALGALKGEVTEALQLFASRTGQSDFYKHAVDFNSQLTDLKARVREATISLRSEYANELKEAEKDLQSIPGWGQLTAEERANSAAAIHQLELEPGEDLQALDRLVAKGYDINKAVSATRQMVEQTGLERVRQREETLRAQSGGGAKRLSETIKAPKVIRSASELGALIDQMNELKARAALYEDIELTISTESGA